MSDGGDGSVLWGGCGAADGTWLARLPLCRPDLGDGDPWARLYMLRLTTNSQISVA